MPGAPSAGAAKTVIEEVPFATDVRVVTFTRAHAEGRESGVSLETETTNLYKLTGGRIRRLEIFVDRDAALRAAGIED